MSKLLVSYAALFLCFALPENAAAAVCSTPAFNAVTPVALPVSGTVKAAVAADIDNNGFDDLLVAITTGPNSGALALMLAGGAGVFPMWDVVTLNGEPNAVAVSRLNDDPWPDVAVATSQGISLWFATIGGHQLSPGGLLASGQAANDVAITHWDGDEYVDIIGLFKNQRVRAYAGRNRHGSYSDSQIVLENPNASYPPERYADRDYGYEPNRVAVGDVRGAGRTSLVLTGDTFDSLQRTSTIQWKGVAIEQYPGAWQPTLRDLDADGNLDLLVTYPQETSFRWWRGDYRPHSEDLNSPAFFDRRVVDLGLLVPAANPSAHSIALADVTGDRLLDAIISDRRNGAVYVVPRNTAVYRGFSFGPKLAGGFMPISVVTGRFDHDGAPDIAVLSDSDNLLRVFRNTCSQDLTNLAVTHIEVVQQIQSLANDVPLIPGRRTFVRAYVSSTNGAPAVTANLYGADANGVTYPRVIKPSNRNQSAIANDTTLRRTLDGALFFELPPEWTTGGDLQLRIEINPDQAVVEANYADNVAIDTVQFAPVPPVKVELIRYVYPSANGDVAPSDDVLTRFESQLRRELPTDRLIVTHGTHRTNRRFAWADTPNVIYTTGNDAADVFNDFVDSTSGTRRSNVIYLVVTGRQRMGGIANRSNDSVAVSGPEAKMAVHEFGHLMGRSHVECSGDEDQTDPMYPYAGGTIGSPRFAGLDVGDASLAVPTYVVWSSSAHIVGDTMSYCGARWFSDYTHEAVADRFRARFPMQDPFGDFLAVSGRVDSAGNVRFTAERRDQASYIPERGKGEYAIRLLDEKGVALADYPFQLLESQEEEAFATFAEIVDFVAGTRFIDIVGREGAQLARRVVSVNTPRMEAQWLEGENGSGPITIEWRAIDDDGDKLTADVLYSADKGANWRVLATRARESLLTLDSQMLTSTHGERTGILRIRVSDGVHIAYRDFIELQGFGSPPTVRITAPFAGSAFAKGQTLVLAATANDVDDGTPPSNAIAWQSDRDGYLGAGELLAPYLSAGEHHITATVMDRDGFTGSATTVVYVGVQPPPPSRPLAVARPPERIALGTPLVLDGTGSSVEGADGLNLYWEVVESPLPPPRTVVLEHGKPGYASFVPTVIGHYVMRLYASAGPSVATADVSFWVER